MRVEHIFATETLPPARRRYYEAYVADLRRVRALSERVVAVFQGLCSDSVSIIHTLTPELVQFILSFHTLTDDDTGGVRFTRTAPESLQRLRLSHTAVSVDICRDDAYDADAAGGSH